MFLNGDSYKIGAHVRRPIILQIFTDGRKLKVEQSDRPCIFQGHNLICRVIPRQITEVCRKAQKERHVRGGAKELGADAVGRGWWRGGGRITSIFNPFSGIKGSALVLWLGWERSRESEVGEGGKRSREQSWGRLEAKQLFPATTSAKGAFWKTLHTTFFIVNSCCSKHRVARCVFWHVL